MLLYKYKGASQLLHLLDIAVHERLFCQTYSQLNDPFEGQFRSITTHANIANLGFTGNFNPNPLRHARINYHNVDELLVPGGTRVCSLSETLSDVRMWSLYAESHQGVAIEIDFAGLEDGVRRVEYVHDLPKYGMTLLGGATPEEVLTKKTTHWDYEKEYRIVGEEAHFSIAGRMKRVILGLRASEELELLLNKILQPKVTITRARLDHEGVCVHPGEIVRQGEVP